MSHRIRLRKPWTREVVRDGECLDRDDRIEMPDLETALSPPTDLENVQSNHATAYHVIYRRRFNRPTGLIDTDRVFLEIDPFPAGEWFVQFNSQPLMERNAAAVATSAGGLPLTSDLQPQNVIEITLTAASDPTKLPTLRANVAVRIESDVSV